MLIRVRVLRPFAWLGRYIGTHERLNLHPDDFEALSKSGHVERIEVDAPVNGTPIDPGPWVRVVTR